jgi:hypothetical protein
MRLYGPCLLPLLPLRDELTSDSYSSVCSNSDKANPGHPVIPIETWNPKDFGKFQTWKCKVAKSNRPARASAARSTSVMSQTTVRRTGRRAYRPIDALAWPLGRAGFFKLGGLICSAAVSADPAGGTPAPQSSANRTTRFFPVPIGLNDPPRHIKITSAATLPANQIKPTSARCGLFHLERRR